MHYGSPSEEMQPLCKIKAYFCLVFSQKTEDFTRFLNDWAIKVGSCFSEGEFASLMSLFSFVTDGQTFLKHIRKYLFHLKIVNWIFRPLCFGVVSEASSCFLLTWTKVLLCRDKLGGKATFSSQNHQQMCAFRQVMQPGAPLLRQSVVRCWFNQLKLQSPNSV